MFVTQHMFLENIYEPGSVLGSDKIGITQTDVFSAVVGFMV